MSGHQDNLVDQTENDETSSNVDIIPRQQPLEPLVFSNEAFSMLTRSQDLESSSANSKTVQASESVPSLPSLDSNYSTNYPNQSHSWPRSSTEFKFRKNAAKHRPSRRPSNNDDSRTICSFPTSFSTTPIESTYSSQSGLQEDLTDSSSSDVIPEVNPYMKRIIWAMASVALMVFGAGLGLVLHSLLESTPDAQPVLEEAQPSDPPVIIDLDLDMGTS